MRRDDQTTRQTSCHHGSAERRVLWAHRPRHSLAAVAAADCANPSRCRRAGRRSWIGGRRVRRTNSAEPDQIGAKPAGVKCTGETRYGESCSTHGDRITSSGVSRANVVSSPMVISERACGRLPGSVTTGLMRVLGQMNRQACASFSQSSTSAQGDGTVERRGPSPSGNASIRLRMWFPHQPSPAISGADAAGRRNRRFSTGAPNSSAPPWDSLPASHSGRGSCLDLAHADEGAASASCTARRR